MQFEPACGIGRDGRRVEMRRTHPAPAHAAFLKPAQSFLDRETCQAAPAESRMGADWFERTDATCVIEPGNAVGDEFAMLVFDQNIERGIVAARLRPS